jgi:hypothetical protein
MHTLITGRTEMGKTSIAKILHNELKKRGNRTAAYSPLKWEWSAADFVTDNGEELLRYLRRDENHGLYVFIDEGASSIGRYQKQYNWLATTSRHYGHSCTFIAHLLTDVSPEIRTQCLRWIMFSSRRRDFDLAMSEYDVDIPSRQLLPGEFLMFDPGVAPRKGKLNFSKQCLTWVENGLRI